MPAVPRRSAHTILLDPSRKVLLIQFSVQRSSGQFVFWATPGGGVEDGETEIEAARRELQEELHLKLPLTGPVHTSNARFEHEGRLVDTTDIFFAAWCEHFEPSIFAACDFERGAMKEARWWSLEEMERSTVPIFPSDLVAAVRSLLSETKIPPSAYKVVTQFW